MEEKYSPADSWGLTGSFNNPRALPQRRPPPAARRLPPAACRLPPVTRASACPTSASKGNVIVSGCAAFEWLTAASQLKKP